MPLSRAFQVPKCVIKARNPRLHRISVAVEGFLLPKGASLPEGIPLDGSSSSRLVVKEGEEKTEKEEEVIELGSFEDEFEVFNRAQSFEDPSGDLGDPNYTEANFPSAETPFEEDMGIQRRQKKKKLAGFDRVPVGEGDTRESSLKQTTFPFSEQAPSCSIQTSSSSSS